MAVSDCTGSAFSPIAITKRVIVGAIGIRGCLIMTAHVPNTSQDHAAREVPVCLKCLTPHTPHQYYCEKCGEGVGRLTPYLPYINIRYNYGIFATLWQRTWFEREVTLPWKVFYLFIIVWFAPIMLLGLPFLWLARRKQEKASAKAAE
jgi:hypothetical protein